MNDYKVILKKKIFKNYLKFVFIINNIFVLNLSQFIDSMARNHEFWVASTGII